MDTKPVFRQWKIKESHSTKRKLADFFLRGWEAPVFDRIPLDKENLVENIPLTKENFFIMNHSVFIWRNFSSNILLLREISKKKTQKNRQQFQGKFLKKKKKQTKI